MLFIVILLLNYAKTIRLYSDIQIHLIKRYRFLTFKHFFGKYYELHIYSAILCYYCCVHYDSDLQIFTIF